MSFTERSAVSSERSTARSVADDRPDRHAIHRWGHDPHFHAFGQLVHALSGRATFTVHPRRRGRSATYVVDTTTVLWIPPFALHSARFDPDFAPSVHELQLDDGGSEARQAVIDDTVRAELLATQWAHDPHLVATRAALHTAHNGPLDAPPRPYGPIAGRLCALLDDDPSDNRTLEEWAIELHTSAMSIRRAFTAETGMTYSHWRTQHRLHAALRMLRRGDRPSRVAHAVGYSEAGFTAAFRRQFGSTPSQLRTVREFSS